MYIDTGTGSRRPNRAARGYRARPMSGPFLGRRPVVIAIQKTARRSHTNPNSRRDSSTHSKRSESQNLLLGASQPEVNFVRSQNQNFRVLQSVGGGVCIPIQYTQTGDRPSAHRTHPPDPRLVLGTIRIIEEQRSYRNTNSVRGSLFDVHIFTLIDEPRIDGVAIMAANGFQIWLALVFKAWHSCVSRLQQARLGEGGILEPTIGRTRHNPDFSNGRPSVMRPYLPRSNSTD
ncbi:hypothetical protein R3P38DRAFT_2780254 [Favolaschia claudopus]|uniref:Uncharacterized protein n=1 Tax=Favolaschia claudopus TaxID=2862362 RepID=A0AAW0BA80_9AGAR